MSNSDLVSTISTPIASTIGRGSLSMTFLFESDNWMPLRCMTNVSGRLPMSAALKPFSAWPEIQPASPQWQTTHDCGLRARIPIACPAATGIITPRRPPLSCVPPGTHETWPGMSRPRRNWCTTESRATKPSAASDA